MDIDLIEGIRVEAPTKEEKKEISSHFLCPVDIWKVIYPKMERRFKRYLKKNEIKTTKMLFHGSRESNWKSIIENGLHRGISGKFGGGIYMTPDARLAEGFAGNGYIGYFDTAYGNPLMVYEQTDVGYGEDVLFVNDKNCIHAAPEKISVVGNYNEVVFFDTNATCLKFLIRKK